MHDDHWIYTATGLRDGLDAGYPSLDALIYLKFCHH